MEQREVQALVAQKKHIVCVVKNEVARFNVKKKDRQFDDPFFIVTTLASNLLILKKHV